MDSGTDGGGSPWGAGLKNGVRKGWGGFLWMVRIIIPISFLTTLLFHSGWLSRLDFLLQPLMGVLGMSPMAALPIIAGMLVGIYGAIAAMAILPLSQTDMTLVAVFALMAHNLIQEGIIQSQSGIGPLKATLFRIVPAVVTVMAVAALMGGTAGAVATAAVTPLPGVSFLQAVGSWFQDTLKLTALIFVIVMLLMITLETLKSLGWIHPIVRFLAPFLRVMGLNEKVGLLWMTAIVFGLAYGGAVIVEEVKNGNLSREDLEALHLSIGMNHSLIEDPTFFLALGVNPFWLYVPRIVMAILTVRLIRLWHWLRRRPAPAGGKG